VYFYTLRTRNSREVKVPPILKSDVLREFDTQMDLCHLIQRCTLISVFLDVGGIHVKMVDSDLFLNPSDRYYQYVLPCLMLGRKGSNRRFRGRSWNPVIFGELPVSGVSVNVTSGTLEIYMRPNLRVYALSEC